MNRSRLQHVVVIGGGMAGLAAAEAMIDEQSRDTASAGRPECRVTLIESSGRFGGVLQTVHRDGWLIERSADSFLAARPEVIEMVERLGLSGELIGVDPRVRRALILHRGRTQSVPSGFRLIAPGHTRSIISTPLLSPRGRLRLLWERFVPARARDVADESLEHFAVRRLGREAFERLVQPLAAGIWTADPARLSMAAACPEFFAMELTDGSLWAGEQKRVLAVRGQRAAGARYGHFLSLASGMETLPSRLADHLAAKGVRFMRASAEEVRRRPDGASWEVVLLDGSGTIEADAVILAVQSTAAAGLLRYLDPGLQAELTAIEYAGSAVVSLGFARDDVRHPLDAAGLVVPRREGRRILAVSFSSQKFPGRAPEGSVLLRTFVGGALDPETASLDDDRLVSLVRTELRHVLGARGTPCIVQIDRWKGAIPQYTVGHLDRMARIRGLVAMHPGLAIAGAAYDGVGIPQVIASGRAAASAVRRR